MDQAVAMQTPNSGDEYTSLDKLFDELFGNAKENDPARQATPDAFMMQAPNLHEKAQGDAADGTTAVSDTPTDTLLTADQTATGQTRSLSETEVYEEATDTTIETSGNIACHSDLNGLK
jgi:hypothetical protein